MKRFWMIRDTHTGEFARIGRAGRFAWTNDPTNTLVKDANERWQLVSKSKTNRYIAVFVEPKEV